MEITCARCGTTTEALQQQPMPTGLGEEIRSRTCPACWKEWMGVQVMLINEYRLNLVDPQARHQLEAELRRFLNLADDKS
jgi:Fe-S cluster biosynthesis and repair protein YggX